jgi:glutaconate CoA-transferase subunit B
MGHLYIARDKYAPEQLKEMKGKYLPTELICCTASREIEDGEVMFVGIGISDLAGAIAKLVYAPNSLMVAESGYIGFAGISTMFSPSDDWGGTMAMCHQGLPETFIDQQAGLIDVAYLGFAQMDRFGNVNVTYITGPKIRMNGSGGGGDIASSAGRVVYTIEFNSRSYVKKLDYITEPGFFDGSPGARKRQNLVGGGPSCVVTDRGVFRFDSETHELYLAEVFPWQNRDDIDEVKKAFPWDLKAAEELRIIEPPTERELWAMRLMDPVGLWTVGKVLDTTLGKLVLSAKYDIEGYNTFEEAREAAWRKAVAILT